MRRVLILGGTSEARELAAALVARPDLEPISSLAGRVRNPRLPEGEVRVGGFGGPAALARWLEERDIAAVVDATHPFAERISASAASACARAGVPIVALRRPGWTAGPGDDWRWAGSLEEAAGALPALGRRPFLTTGRQGLSAFAHLDRLWFLIRTVDPPTGPLPPRRHLVLDRGPYTIPGERALVQAHGIDVIVTKDSGGTHTAAKLAVARELGLPVVVVRRPPRPPAPAATSVAEALVLLEGRLQAG